MISHSLNNNFRMGLRDGLPIGLGYIAVSFAFGLVACASGLSGYQAILISMLNVTSAGQLAAVPIIAGGGGITELVLTQLVINSRYGLMSVSYSQRLGNNIRMADRLWIGFVNTDEVFAVSMGKEQMLGRKYLLGIIIFPYIGWICGTALGALAGNILPALVLTALSISMYAMFIAIVTPIARRSLGVAVASLGAIGITCLFTYVPLLDRVPAGFVTIIAAVSVSVLCALLFPIKEEAKE